MQGDRTLWPILAQRIHRWGLGNMVADTLEAAGPLAIFGAQFLYIGQPFLKGLIPASQLMALAGLMEDASQRQDFAAFLRREEPQ